MYCCQNTTQYPVKRTRNHINRLIPASTSTNSAHQTHQGTEYWGSMNNPMRNTNATSNTGTTSRELPTTMQKFPVTGAIEGGAASPRLGGSLKEMMTTKNIAKTLSAPTRQTPP